MQQASMVAQLCSTTHIATGFLYKSIILDLALICVCRFAMALTGPPQDVVVGSPDGGGWRARSLLGTAAHFVWEVSADVLRAVWLFVLFAPLAIGAPFALNWNWQREEWMELLRCASAVSPESCVGWVASLLLLLGQEWCCRKSMSVEMGSATCWISVLG